MSFMRYRPLKTPVMGWCLENITHEVDIETRVEHVSLCYRPNVRGDQKTKLFN